MKKTFIYAERVLIVTSLIYIIAMFVIGVMREKFVCGFLSIVHETYRLSGVNPWFLIWLYPIELFSSILIVGCFWDKKKLSVVSLIAYIIDLLCLVYCFANNMFEKFSSSVRITNNGVAWQVVLSFELIIMFLLVYRIIKMPMSLPKSTRDCGTSINIIDDGAHIVGDAPLNNYKNTDNI